MWLMYIEMVLQEVKGREADAQCNGALDPIHGESLKETFYPFLLIDLLEDLPHGGSVQRLC